MRLSLLCTLKNYLSTPPQSPDLNSIENLWQILDIKIKKKKISEKPDLRQALKVGWPQIKAKIATN